MGILERMKSGPAKTQSGQPPENSAVVSPDANQSGGELPTSLDGVIEKRRGVKPGTKRGPYKKSGGPAPGPADNPGVVTSAPVSGFTPEDTALLVELPFNLAAFKTGWEGFLLTPEQREVLSRSGTIVLNQFVKVDPKYTALAIFSLALLKIGGEKALIYRSLLREEAARQKAATTGKETPQNATA